MKTLISAILLSLAYCSTATAVGLSGQIAAGVQFCSEQTPATTPRYTSIIGYWKFNGVKSTSLPIGTAIPAAIGPAATVAGSTALTYEPARIDQAMLFNGAGYLTIPNTASLKPALPISMSVWLKMTALPATGKETSIFSGDSWAFGGATGYAGYQLSLERVTGGVRVLVSVGDASGDGATHRRSGTAPTVLTVGIWYHIVAVIQSETNIQIYINGVDTNATPSGSGGLMAYGTAGAQIGYYTNTTSSGAEKLKGTLDDLTIWNAALTAAEAATLYQNQRCSY